MTILTTVPDLGQNDIQVRGTLVWLRDVLNAALAHDPGTDGVMPPAPLPPPPPGWFWKIVGFVVSATSAFAGLGPIVFEPAPDLSERPA